MVMKKTLWKSATADQLSIEGGNMADAINIILGNIGDLFQALFDITDDNGKSIVIGTYSKNGSFRKLRITIEDIKKLQGE